MLLPVFGILCFCQGAFSQTHAFGGFASTMKASFYSENYSDSPHDGYKSKITSGGGINFSFIKEGNREGNLRVNTLSLETYQKQTDSIHAWTYNSGGNSAITFSGTQTSRYSFFTIEHSNYLTPWDNPFLYFIVGFQVGAGLNSSSYDLPGHSSSMYMDPGDRHGNLPALSPCVFGGLHTGMSYEFEKAIIVARAKTDMYFFRPGAFSIGSRIALNVGVMFPF